MKPGQPPPATVSARDPQTIRIAVTGASGFIGRHLVAALVAAGHSVLPISRRPATVAGVECRGALEVWDAQFLGRLFDRCDVVVHLAALAHVRASRDAFLAANRDLTSAVALAARESGVKRLVLISSIGVNGSRTQGRPFSSPDPAAPQELYALTKQEAEQRAQAVLRGSKTEWVVLRPTLVYGPGCPGNFRKLMTLARYLPLVPLGGLDKPRSLMYVGNLCEAIRLASLHPAAAGKTYLLSDGIETSVAGAARALVRGYGKDPRRVVRVPSAVLQAAAALMGRSETFRKLADELLVDPGAFRRDTGWTPKLTPDEALESSARTEQLAESAAGKS